MRPCPSLVTLSVSLLILLPLSAGAAGKTLYVKTSGNDLASCTAAAPCKTITRAVSVADPADTIAVGAGTFGEGAGLSIKKDLTIAGTWFLATRVILGFFDRSQKRPVFLIEPGAKVKLTNLTISEGNGGGIQNQGSLTLTNVWVTNNTGGYAIYNSYDATLSMTNVGVTHNSAPNGFDNRGTAFLVDSRVEATSHLGASQGDGIYNEGAMIVSRGLIAGNDGAGFAQGGAPNDCTAAAYLINVTISGNRNRGITAGCGQLILRHVTIAANTAPGGAPAGLQVYSTIPVLENSIVATNGGKQCGFLGDKSIDISYSLVGDDSCTSFLFPSASVGNLAGVDPKLSALAYRVGEELITKLFHIGANRVQAPLPGSPAIDSGADALCANPFAVDGGGSLSDQLGFPRPVDGDGDGKARCDMGAYEYQPPK